MEQISQLMVIVYGVLCVFGLLNCILGYRILRFWMMIFGFIIGAGAGFGVTYMSGVQDKMVIAGAMAGLGIVLAVVSFLIYRAGIFVLGFGIGITLSIYLIHPTSSFSFFLCILIGVGLGILAMRYAKGVIIVGTVYWVVFWQDYPLQRSQGWRSFHMASVWQRELRSLVC